MRRLLLGLVLLALATPVSAATYYVATTGAAVSCPAATNPNTPRHTIKTGIACLAPGDTLLVRGGTYTEWLSYGSIPSGTNWTTGLIRIAAYPGTDSPGAQSGSYGTPAGWEVVTMKPVDTGIKNGGADFILAIGNSSTLQYVEFDGINLDASGGMSVAGGAVHHDVVRIDTGTHNLTDHIRLKNLKIVGNNNPGDDVDDRVQFVVNPGLNASAVGYNEFINLEMTGGAQSTFRHDFKSGFYLNTNHNLIDSCYMHDATGSAIEIYSANLTTPDNNIIRNNLILNYADSDTTVRDDGIIIGNGTGNAVYNNVVARFPTTGNPSFAIGLELGATNTLVYNNTVYLVTGNGGIWVDNATVGTGNVVRNNLSYSNTNGDFVGSTGTTFDHNLSGDATARGMGSLRNRNPFFVNAGTNNFQLKATSPAINRGVMIDVVTTDLRGVARPQGAAHDIGAYEFVFGGPKRGVSR